MRSGMRIALPYTWTDGVGGYLSDTAITILTVADILREVCHVSVTLVCMNNDGVVWWPDYMHLREMYSVVAYSPDLQFDAVIDVQCHTSPTLRRNMAGRGGQVIGFWYDNCLINEIQEFTYLHGIQRGHSIRGEFDTMWVWAENVDPTQIPVLEELYGCPVVRVPFLWSQRCVERVQDRSEEENRIDTLRFTIVANNTDSTNGAILPLVGLNSLPQIETCHCIGSNGIQGTGFFKENVEKHLHFANRVQYTDAMEIGELDERMRDGQTCISHLRFVRFLPHQIHLAWLYGERLVHNSHVLREMSVGYFSNNSTRDMIRAIEDLRHNRPTLSKVRTWLHDRFGLDVKERVDVWKSLIVQRHIRITFSDMWEGFNPSCNFFIDMLRWAGWEGAVGEAWRQGTDGDMHICGPFGFVWKSVGANVPIVFFSGERWQRNDVYETDSRIRLFLTHDVQEDERHMRFPLWITYLALFGMAGDNVQQNPMRAPLEWATMSQRAKGGGERSKFCAFVASNPGNPIRNKAFIYLNKYKDVDSGGRFMNTIGEPIEAKYGGGGGGELAKMAFYREREFCIAFENSGAPGYVTEKLLHAKMAGCIPIYWGDEMACRDFDPRGFISMCGKDPADIVEIVDELCRDPAQCAYMSSIPALGEKELRAMWDRIEMVCAKLSNILCAYKEPAQITYKKREKMSMPPVRHAPLFVSFATQRFIPSILQSLTTLNIIRTRECPGLQYLLYTGSDVTDEDIAPICHMGAWISVRKLPTDVLPAGDAFPDFWSPHHFGWKLWIYNQIVHEFADKLLVYSDAGAQWQNMYDAMFTKAWDTGACFVVDHNLNKHWCSPEMIASMSVTEEELAVQQILGGIVAMRGGHEGACAFFKKCYELGLNPVNLRGRKLIRILPSGQPIGHRHDQSIMSVIRARTGLGFETVGVDDATCCESLRRTHLTGRPIYLHRGTYLVNKRHLSRTDDVWIINLNRRMDRIQQWAQAYPELASIAQRFQAIDGRELHMTPAISELFQRNDFKWKRSVVGCALSHILLWAQLACEGNGAESYLILEDDMRFGREDWSSALQEALDTLPEDVDVAMLGGILPNNRSIYQEAITPVNDVWSVVKPNTLFSQSPAPIFHFCAYSYYLTKRGAIKLLQALRGGAGGCFTSIDHFLGFPHTGCVRYVMTRPITVCFQESDPRYVNSQFDNFDRVDSFDSDIWNNNEVFSQTDRDCGLIYGARQSLFPVLSDVVRQVPSDIQTRMLLEPGRYQRMLREGKESDAEVQFMNIFVKILEKEIVDPALIRIWQRKNTCCIASDDTVINADAFTGICGDEITIIRVAPDRMEKACIYAKLFAVHPGMSVQDIAERVDVTGCIPFYLRTDGDDAFWEKLHGVVPILELRSIGAAKKFIEILVRDVKKAEMYRAGLLAKVRGS